MNRGLAADVDSVIQHSAAGGTMTPEARHLLEEVKRTALGQTKPASAALPSWAVACVLTKHTPNGVVRLALRHGQWFAENRSAAIGAATEDALRKNPGWLVAPINTVEIPPNSGDQP